MAANVGSIEATLTARGSQFKKEIRGATKSVSGLQSALAGLGVGIAIKKATALAAEQEKQETKLAAAIAASGQAIDINKIKAYASELQKVTTFGDEVTLSAAAMMASFGASEDALIKLLPKIQDMSTQTGQAADSIAMVMGRALAGNASMLSRYGIELTDAERKVFKLGTQQERVAVLTQKLGEKFGGSAEAMAKTSSGAIAQMGNSLGDVAEDIGELINQGLAPLARIVRDLADRFTSWFDSLDTGERTLLGISTGIGLISTALIAMGPLLLSTGKRMVLAFAPVLATVAAVVAAIGLAITTYGLFKRALSGDFAKEGESFADILKRGFTDGVAELKSGLSDAFGDIFKKEDSPQRRRSGGRGGSSGGAASSAKDPFADMDFGESFEQGFADADKRNQAAIDRFSKNRIRQIENETKLYEDFVIASEAAAERQAQAAASLGSFAAGAAANMAQSMGKAGSVISAAMEGASQGGIWGAIIGTVMEIAQQSDSFKRASQALNALLSDIVDAFEPLFAGLEPFTMAINAVIKILVMTMGPALEILGGILQGIGRVVAGVAWVIGKVLLLLSKVWNKMVNFLLGVVRKMDDIWGINMNGTIRALERMRVNTGEMSDAVDELGQIATGEIDRLPEVVDDLADSAKEASESLLNVPHGYKVALARFNATDAMQAATPGVEDDVTPTGDTTNVTISTVNLDPQDPVEFLEQLEQISATGSYVSTGTALRSDFTRRVTP